MLRRMGEMAEVAAAGTFLCSQDAKFITGKSYINPIKCSIAIFICGVCGKILSMAEYTFFYFNIAFFGSLMQKMMSVPEIIIQIGTYLQVDFIQDT